MTTLTLNAANSAFAGKTYRSSTSAERLAALEARAIRARLLRATAGMGLALIPTLGLAWLFLAY